MLDGPIKDTMTFVVGVLDGALDPAVCIGVLFIENMEIYYKQL